MKAIVLVLLLAAVLRWQPLPPSAALASSSSLQHVALKLADLPSGFRQTRAAVVGNAEAARRDHLDLGLLERHGRIASYETAFSRALPFGLVLVEDEVTTYRTAEGAQWDYSAWAGSMRKTANELPGSMRQVAGGSVGADRVAYAVKDATDGVPLTDYVVLFRRGTSWAMLLAAGRTGTISPDVALHLAELIDTRLASAVRP